MLKVTNIARCFAAHNELGTCKVPSKYCLAKVAYPETPYTTFPKQHSRLSASS